MVKPVNPPRVPVRDLFGGMNKLEKHRAIQLEAMKRGGLIADWWYERFTLKLADDCRWTPDFLIQENDGSLRLEDTKGHMREDAHIKMKVAAQHFPFPITVLYKDGRDGWKTEAY